MDRVRAIFDRPGSYLTAIGDCERNSIGDLMKTARSRAEELGAPSSVLHALEMVPTEVAVAGESDEGPEGGLGSDFAGLGVVVSADGAAEVFTSPDPPRRTIVRYSALPYVAPMLEWDQRDVPHIVIVATDVGYELIAFGPGELTRSGVESDIDTAEKRLRTLVEQIEARLIVVGGDELRAREAARHFRAHLPPSALVTILPDDDRLSLDRFADAIVRRVSTLQATDTVDALKDFRFERAHGATEEGMADAIRALRTGHVRALLVHDDPDDRRTVAMARPGDLSSIGETGAADAGTSAVRLVDALIALAFERGADVRIIPSTGPHGPADDIGVIVDHASWFRLGA